MSPTFDEIIIGQIAKYTRTITETDIEKFADVSGDHNPVHMNEEYAKTTIFKGRIAHGLLSASFISTVLASQLPGPGSIYLKQELKFLKPVRIGDNITTKVEVLKKDVEKKRVTLSTVCINQESKIVIEGKAVVMIN
ncbi:MAG: MaoC family dehydratase [Candidatus Hodarchaeales archaeon]|jgi:3-hydroxybutyryl-CoA dehydratase